MVRKSKGLDNGPVFSVREMKIIAGNSNLPLARKIAKKLGVELGKVKVGRFSDGEIQVKIDESMRGLDVFVIQSTCNPVNDNLMELLIIMDALRRASARRVYPVIPYYGYSRQDKKVQPREPITARLVANLIESCEASRVLCMDLHSNSIQGFFNLPVDNLTAINNLVGAMHQHGLVHSDMIVVSPDVGGVQRANEVTNKIERFYGLKVPLAIIAKRRPEPNVSEVLEVIGDVKGKTAVIFDDMIDTAGSVTNGAEELTRRGAKEVHVYATHGLMSGNAYSRLDASPIKKVVVTDTIPLHRRSNKVEVVSTAGIFARAIKNCFEDQSISQIFHENLVD
ncbi:MAG: ribose-phosphate pyrophosphokinase [bacterium]|jgi:ribose-phosphate pyrophosphokinase